MSIPYSTTTNNFYNIGIFIGDTMGDLNFCVQIQTEREAYQEHLQQYRIAMRLYERRGAQLARLVTHDATENEIAAARERKTDAFKVVNSKLEAASSARNKLLKTVKTKIKPVFG